MNTTTLWIRSDYGAAYPNLEAAGKALQRSGPNDSFTLTRRDLPEGQLGTYRGVLTNDEGRIERSPGKRVLDGLCGTASALGSLACLGLGLVSFGTIIGALLFGPQLLEGSLELGVQAARQFHRGVTGASDEGTAFARDRAREADAGGEVALLTRSGESVQAQLGEQSWLLSGPPSARSH